MSLRHAILVLLLVPCAGCMILPECNHQPTLHNPFPQLTKVAVVPFFNHSNEPTTDGRRFAMAYASEVQQIPASRCPVGLSSRPCGKRTTVWMARGCKAPGQQLGVDAVLSAW